ncbi:unnamed protein product [Absidia cylindrospora]
MVTSYITRTASFSAAHRLHSTKLSDEENAATYGKCNHPHFHGHNYKLEITVKGKIDPVTGMVMNMVDLKNCIEAAVMNPLDHRNLDLDVEYFEHNPSTVENLAVFIWNNFNEHFGKQFAYKTSTARLYKVKIYETEHNSVEYLGEDDD